MKREEALFCECFWETNLTSLRISLLKCKPTDSLTERANCTCLLGFRGRGLHGGPWQRPPEAWAAMKPPGPQARPRGAGPAPGAQRQRTAGEHRGVAHALPTARSNWPRAPPRLRPGKFSRSTAPQAALTPHHRAPCSRSPPPWGLSTQSQWAPSKAGRQALERTDRPTDRRTD